MKKQFALAVLVLAVGSGSPIFAAEAQGAPAASQKPTFATVLDRGISQIEKEVVTAADAMPDDKFDFRPPTTMGEFNKVRTFAEQVKHIAAANYMLGAGILGEKPPLDLKGENGPDSIKGKADVMKFLKDSFEYAHKAMNSVTEANVLEQIQSPFGPNKVTRLSLAIGTIAHPQDHYGQMVVYLRMNNIIPPASRQ